MWTRKASRMRCARMCLGRVCCCRVCCGRETGWCSGAGAAVKAVRSISTDRIGSTLATIVTIAVIRVSARVAAHSARDVCGSGTRVRCRVGSGGKDSWRWCSMCCRVGSGGEGGGEGTGGARAPALCCTVAAKPVAILYTNKFLVCFAIVFA